MCDSSYLPWLHCLQCKDFAFLLSEDITASVRTIALEMAFCSATSVSFLAFSLMFWFLCPFNTSHPIHSSASGEGSWRRYSVARLFPYWSVQFSHHLIRQGYTGARCFVQELTSCRFFGAPVVDLLEKCLLGNPLLIYKLVPVMPVPGEVTCGFGACRVYSFFEFLE